MKSGSMKNNNKYYTVGTFLKYNIKVIERSRIDIINT